MKLFSNVKLLLPTENTKNQVKHKKWAHQDESGEIDPRPFHSYGIIHLLVTKQDSETLRPQIKAVHS